MANNLINGHILFIWLVVCTLLDASIIDPYHFSRELLTTIVPILWYCSHFPYSRSYINSLIYTNLFKQWFENIMMLFQLYLYIFLCYIVIDYFTFFWTYFGLFYLFVTHAKDCSRILKYSVIVGEITEPKCPHNNKQKFERFGWNESRPFPVQIHPRTIYFLVISVSRPEVAVLRNNLTLTALDPFPLYFS